jgi:hypothetical protein
MIFAAHWFFRFPLEIRCPRGFSVYPAASQLAVFALGGDPVHLADFSLYPILVRYLAPIMSAL